MQETPNTNPDNTHQSNAPEQTAGQPPRNDSGFAKLVLVIVVLLIAAGFYWYLNTPQVATFENKAIATFNANHNFDSPDLKQYGDGIVVIAPYFKRNEDISYVDLGVNVWAKQLGRVVQINSVAIDNLTLPNERVPLLSPGNVQNSLFTINATIKEKIPVEELIEAARKSGGKLKLTVNVVVSENVPQRRNTNLNLTYEFDVRSQHVTPWSE